ncbi:MAG TPA: hypothetical protein EYP41_09560 [Anaerolineae bacterium]|nr:hypothetical protein [Anaerolineae bacterium]
MNARKQRIESEAAWQMLSQAKDVYVVNGRKINHWQPNEINKEAILAKAIGRSGNLRAPTLKVGDTYIIGFDKTLYEKEIRDWRLESGNL